MSYFTKVVSGLLAFGVVGCHSPARASKPSPAATIVGASDVEWQKLNPARGDKSPQAATLWGDRHGPVPTGFLAKFVEGFSSPPHIHNATYRAVVISGQVHNDDPEAAPMWMPPGSFWTQPKGEVHITSAKDVSVALVEIDKGPYLVKPPAKAFDSGERPVNLATPNIVWVDPPGVPALANGPKLAYLWGSLDKGRDNGTFVKLPAGSRIQIRSQDSLRAVVIFGRLRHDEDRSKPLDPGSYFGSQGKHLHSVSNEGPRAGVLYVRSRGPYELLKEGH